VLRENGEVQMAMVVDGEPMLRANLPFGQIGAYQLVATTHFAIWTWPFSRSTDNSSLRSSGGLYF
jgi:hypothetical protein